MFRSHVRSVRSSALSVVRLVLVGLLVLVTHSADSLAQGRMIWIGEIGGIGPGSEVRVRQITRDPFVGPLTITARNTGSQPWGDFHFGIYDPLGGQDISEIDFLDASMGGADPLSSQSGLHWTIDNEIVGARLDLFYCSDPVMPGETVSFTVYVRNPGEVGFFGVLFYPTPVPPTGVCCSPGGSCTIVCKYDCLPPSDWSGGSTSCVPNPCPEEHGACCDPSNGSCTFVIEAECRPPGDWHLDWSCDPNPCPVPVGVCCFVDGHCEILTQEQCLAAVDHLEWSAAGTTCTPSPCMQPEACCDPGTGACTYTLQRFCAPPLIFVGGVCTPNPCEAPVPTQNTTWGRIKATYR